MSQCSAHCTTEPFPEAMRQEDETIHQFFLKCIEGQQKGSIMSLLMVYESSKQLPTLLLSILSTVDKGGKGAGIKEQIKYRKRNSSER